jgi:small subunit ribosomal protein S9
MAKETVYYATGKRKNAIARTWLTPGKGEITINDRSVEDFFKVGTAKTVMKQPLVLTNNLDAFNIKIRVAGGGHFRSGRRRSSWNYQGTDSV